ncbi:MAG: malonyl-CoA synthase [bacterium]|nr:malonyl-CoA synthase [bacterium]
MTNATSHNLFSFIYRHITDWNTPFLHFSNADILTYADMLKRSAQYANCLVSLGVKPGDRVAAQVEKSPDALFLYLGCLRAGGVFLPLNMGYKDKELAYFITDAEPALVACTSARKDALEEIIGASGFGRVETFDQSGDGSLIEIADGSDLDFEDLHREEDDLAAILYTSGTTGRSKGAMLTHKNLSSNAQTLVEYWQFTSKDILLHALPIFHTHGLFVATNTVLCSGGSMIFQSRFDVEDVLNALPRATCMMGVPTFYTRLLASPQLTRDLVSHIRVFISGSAPLSPETHKYFEQQTGQAILERYGMTETSMNTSNPFGGERRASTVGFPLPGIEIRIANIESGEILATNDVGVIEIRGPNVFKGYWRMPEKTAEEFRNDGFFISGDLGFIDKRGYLSIVGRNKDLIISGGFNIYPAEVENALDAINGIIESAVIGVPHPDFGEGVTAVVVSEDERTLTVDNIRTALGDDLANYKLPKRVFFVDALPRNKMGKIQKNQLREKFQTAYQA